MTDFTYTHKTDPVLSGSRPSEVLSYLYYNEKTKELLVGVKDNNNAYVYTGVPKHVYDAFAIALSKGYFWNKIVKPQYGPADDAGWADEVNLVEYGSVRIQGTVGTPKGLTDATAATSASVLAFPLSTDKPQVAQIKQNATAEVTFDDAIGTTVLFNFGGEDRTVDFDDKFTVRDAVAEVSRIADMLGMGKTLTIKAVTVRFE